MALAILCVLGSADAAEPARQFTLDYAHWDYDIDGFVINQDERLDFQRDLSVEARSRADFGLRWDTGPGWWPDLALRMVPIEAGGQRELTTSPGGPLPLPLPGTTTVVLADADLDDLELTLRYPVVERALRVWIGATIKRLDGSITTRTENDTESVTQEVDETFPLLHGQLEWPLGARFTLGASGNWIARGDDEASELRALASWRIAGPLALNAGWQRRQYRLQGDEYRLDSTLQGAFAGAGLVFD